VISNLEPLLIKIGAKLIELRKLKGYTNHETFALDYDIPRVQYWRLEHGKTNLTLKSLLKILALHKLNFEEFIRLLSLNSEEFSRYMRSKKILPKLHFKNAF
jgi:transcriptional regulator with XRE-family HTH domain